VGFFLPAASRLSAVSCEGRIMIILNEKETLSREEKFVALAHLYLELHLSLQGATAAAAADLACLDGSQLVAEAA
jgi:tRNA(Phe) wybutosine-synthesizing methylase Tyw3